MEVVHYTSHKNWRRIQKKGKLEPRTTPNREALDLFLIREFGLPIDISQKYIVGIPTEALPDWEDNKLKQEVEKKTTGEIELKVELSTAKGVLVRDHYLTPEEMNIINNPNRNYQSPFLPPILRFPREIVAAKKRYLTSTQPLETADFGKIKVPEIWIPYSIPSQSITATECKPPRSIFQELLSLIG